jgi:hypothetical protein
MDRFYGDPVARFRAMATASSEDPIDRAHFSMWCRIAADEIEALKVAL